MTPAQPPTHGFLHGRLLLLGFALAAVGLLGLSFGSFGSGVASAQAPAAPQTATSFTCAPESMGEVNCTLTLNAAIGPDGSFSITLAGEGNDFVGCNNPAGPASCQVNDETLTYSCPKGCAAGGSYLAVIAGAANLAGATLSLSAGTVPVVAASTATSTGAAAGSGTAATALVFNAYCVDQSNKLVPCVLTTSAGQFVVVAATTATTATTAAQPASSATTSTTAATGTSTSTTSTSTTTSASTGTSNTPGVAVVAATTSPATSCVSAAGSAVSCNGPGPVVTVAKPVTTTCNLTIVVTAGGQIQGSC